MSRLSLGIHNLDYFFGGGLEPRKLIEFTGDSGVGKSTICMEFCIAVQRLSGANGGAVFLNTSKIISSTRLAQISQNFKIRFATDLPDDPMSQIFLKQITHEDRDISFELLMYFLQFDLPILINEKNVKLIVIDSITSLFRDYKYSPDYFHPDQKIRLARLKLVYKQLNYLRLNYNIYILIVNELSMGLPALARTWKGFLDYRYFIFTEKVWRNQRRHVICQDIPFKRDRVNFRLGDSGIVN